MWAETCQSIATAKITTQHEIKSDVKSSTAKISRTRLVLTAIKAQRRKNLIELFTRLILQGVKTCKKIRFDFCFKKKKKGEICHR